MAADLTGAPTFAAFLTPLLVSSPGGSAGGAPLHVFPGRSLRHRTLYMWVMVSLGRGSLIRVVGTSGSIGGSSTCACAHGLGDDLELVGTVFVVLLFVLYTAVVLEEELARLLEYAAALADGTESYDTNLVFTQCSSWI